jgi:2,3-bisphosphoglycerate-dependent phosphoglycerate mutase
MHKIVFLRHGESVWNKENRFTGWQDVDLSEKGRAEALEAGRTLKKLGFEFDLACVSVLKRALRTLFIVQDEMDALWMPVLKSWRLNERHYGALTGLNKSETAARHGEEQVKIWRRSYDVPPPSLEITDDRHPSKDKKYQKVPGSELPSGESLKLTVDRVLPFWNAEIAPRIKKGEKLLIAAHGNSLRALIQHIEKMSPEQIMEVNVPTGIPLLYELDQNLNFIRKEYLGDPDTIQAAMDHVAGQGKAKPAGKGSGQ